MADKSASQQIDDIIKTHAGWKGEILSQVRAAIAQAHPAVLEEIKWKMPTRPAGLPVWSHNGMICFAEIWKDNVKLIFTQGAQLNDKDNLFNARLKSRDVRAIEFHENDSVNAAGLAGLILEAVDLNESKKRA